MVKIVGGNWIAATLFLVTALPSTVFGEGASDQLPLSLYTATQARIALSGRCDEYFTSIKGHLKQIKPLDVTLKCKAKFRPRDADGNILPNTETVLMMTEARPLLKIVAAKIFGPTETDSRGIARVNVTLRKNRSYSDIHAGLPAFGDCKVLNGQLACPDPS